MKFLALTYNDIFCTKTANIAIFRLFMWKSNLSLVGGFLKGKTNSHAFPVINYLHERYPRCRTLNSNFCLLSSPSTTEGEGGGRTLIEYFHFFFWNLTYSTYFWSDWMLALSQISSAPFRLFSQSLLWIVTLKLLFQFTPINSEFPIPAFSLPLPLLPSTYSMNSSISATELNYN